MTTIGTFTQQNDGYTGAVRTLTVNVKVKFVPNDKSKENAPDFRILAGNYEIGAAWKKTAQSSQREYLSVTRCSAAQHQFAAQRADWRSAGRLLMRGHAQGPPP